MSKTIMIMAGGTGGHVYPAIAVADYLKMIDWKVVWLVTEGGMENTLIAGKPYEIATIQMQGVRGKGFMRLLRLPLQLFKACMQSAKAIKQHKPDVVLGMGGYAAFPGGIMARLFGKPLVIHEQNSVAGLTNKVLAKIATQVLVAFPGVLAPKAIRVGNPVRRDMTKLALPETRLKSRKGRIRILVVGGSLGAQVLNDTVPQALALLDESMRPEVIHQSGTKHIEALKEAYQKANVTADTRAYIDDMTTAYAWADLVICRSGALTVAELSAIGVASILVPFPSAVDDHQTTNAEYLALEEGAILMPQAQLTAQKLADVIRGLSRDELKRMAQITRSLAMPYAAKMVAQHCIEVTK